MHYYLPAAVPTLITPDLAREYLKHNTANRLIIQAKVDLYAAEIVNGRFVASYDPVMFHLDDGTLGNAQHRLLAIIQAGIAVWLLVARNVPREVILAHDLGKTRSIANQLQLQDGLKNANMVTGAVKAVVSLCCGHQNLPLSLGMTRAVLADLSEDITTVIQHLRRYKPAMKVWCIGPLAFALNADRRLLPFIEQLGSGENLTKGSPAFAVRDWLTHRNSTGTHIYQGTRIEGLLNAAYNAVMGQSITVVKSGVRGIEYFSGQKAELVIGIQDQMGQQINA